MLIIDGQPVGKGVEVPVRSGTRIGVANTLTLSLADVAWAGATTKTAAPRRSTGMR